MRARDMVRDRMHMLPLLREIYQGNTTLGSKKLCFSSEERHFMPPTPGAPGDQARHLGVKALNGRFCQGSCQWGNFPKKAPLVGSSGAGVPGMDCVCCGSVAVSERPECTAQGYRRFRCHDCGKQFNERNAGLLNRAQYPSDVIALVVLWRLRYRLTLRDLSEMFLHRGIVFSYESVREWEAQLAPVLAGELRQRRWGKGCAVPAAADGMWTRPT
jgi:transposase-like protein